MASPQKEEPRRKKPKMRKAVVIPLAFAALMVFNSTNQLALTSNWYIVGEDPTMKAVDTTGSSFNVLEASSDNVVEATLLQLAQMKPQDLQGLLEGDDDSKNPFQLDQLQEGKCPESFEGEIPWLPKRQPSELSERFKAQMSGGGQEGLSTGPVVALYYDHLSKAGGTSFCKLAQTNMPKEQVPPYYCMPARSKTGGDGRIGRWELERVQQYLLDKTHRIVSNEWDPFDRRLLSFFSPKTNNMVHLLFATTIRHPINRLLSSHKFFEVLRRNNKERDAHSFEKWLSSCARSSKKYKPSLDSVFRINICRFNFAIWKFSGGKLPLSEMNLEAASLLTQNISVSTFENNSLTEEQWEQPFKDSVRTLARFDLVIPMEELSKHPEPLTEIFGWTNFSQTHVVTTGKIVNNKASSELPSTEYDLLWQSNSLDMILYYWTWAVYLTRLHCRDIID
eukprot:scaffold3987_cov134-Cylindrotheca_fusiformis.AAC.2